MIYDQFLIQKLTAVAETVYTVRCSQLVLRSVVVVVKSVSKDLSIQSNVLSLYKDLL